MSKYRCPICGANHKEQVANCRLCGQSMSPSHIPTQHAHVATLYEEKTGIKGIAMIGLAIVVVIVIGAVLFGVVRPTRELEVAKDFVTGEDISGWATMTDDAGRYAVDLPSPQTKETIPFSATDDGKLVAVTVPISTDTKITVGYGPVAPPIPAEGTPLSFAAVQNFLKDTTAPKWVAGNGITLLETEQATTSLAGYPAFVVKSLKPAFKVGTKEAYGQAAFVLKGSTLYVVQVLSIYKDAPQFDKILNSFVISA